MLLIRQFNGKVLILQCAPVAQLDRASDFESAGRPFESGRVHYFHYQMDFTFEYFRIFSSFVTMGMPFMMAVAMMTRSAGSL